MGDPSPKDIQHNIELLKEEIATLRLEQDKDTLVIYGSKDIHLPGLLNRVELSETAIKNINGMPQQVKELSAKVDCLIETDRKRVNFIRGAIAGYGIQVGGLVAILIKVFS